MAYETQIQQLTNKVEELEAKCNLTIQENTLFQERNVNKVKIHEQLKEDFTRLEN
jgi:hypothetical protein